MCCLTVLAIFVLLITILISLVAILVPLISILILLVAMLDLPAWAATMLAAIVAMHAAIVAMLIPLSAMEIPHSGVGLCSRRNNRSSILAMMTVRGCGGYLARSILVLSGHCRIRRGKLPKPKTQSGENDYIDCYAIFHWFLLLDLFGFIRKCVRKWNCTGCHDICFLSDVAATHDEQGS